MKTNVVAIAFSGKMASGKDYVADRFSELFTNSSKVSFADALKREVDSIFAYVTDESSKNTSCEDFCQIFYCQEEEYERISEIVQDFPEEYNWERKTDAMREALQVWGTEVRRKQDELYWVKKVEEKIRDNYRNGIFSIITDVRFYNEAESLRSFGVPIVRLVISPDIQIERIMNRDGGFDFSRLSHISEVDLDDFHFDLALDGSKDSSILVKQIYDFLKIDK